MVKISFVEHDGSRTEVDAEEGLSLMKAATYGGVPGISADCGGNCACGTCRIYVSAQWRHLFVEPKASELEMIDYSQDRTDGVRLACQNKVTAEMDGLELHLPENQMP